MSRIVACNLFAITKIMQLCLQLDFMILYEQIVDFDKSLSKVNKRHFTLFFYNQNYYMWIQYTYIYLSIYMFIYPYTQISIYLHTYLFIYLFMHLFIHLSFYISFYLFTYLPNFFIYLSIRLSISLSIYLLRLLLTTPSWTTSTAG